MKKKKPGKEIRNKVEAAFNKSLDGLKIAQPSDKTRKLVRKAAKAVAKQLKSDLKKQLKLKSKSKPATTKVAKKVSPARKRKK